VADKKIVGSVTAQYNERIKNALDAAGIEIPFPHVQLLVKETSALRTRTDGNGSPRPLAA
jgi:small-conductance mechanosensitive channel